MFCHKVHKLASLFDFLENFCSFNYLYDVRNYLNSFFLQRITMICLHNFTSKKYIIRLLSFSCTKMVEEIKKKYYILFIHEHWFCFLDVNTFTSFRRLKSWIKCPLVLCMLWFQVIRHTTGMVSECYTKIYKNVKCLCVKMFINAGYLVLALAWNTQNYTNSPYNTNIFNEMSLSNKCI